MILDKFQRIILTWKQEQGGRVTTNSEDRANLIIELFKSLEAGEFTKDEILSTRNILRIKNACVNPTSKKRELWGKSVERSIEMSIGTYYKETLIKSTEEEKNKLKKLMVHAETPYQAKEKNKILTNIEWAEVDITKVNNDKIEVVVELDSAMADLLGFEE